MTPADLLDWIKTHGCEIVPLPEYKARVILFKNPKNNQEAYLNVPPPDRIKDFTIFRICTKLAIPIPTHTEYMKILNEKLKNDHNI